MWRDIIIIQGDIFCGKVKGSRHVEGYHSVMQRNIIIKVTRRVWINMKKYRK